MSNFINLGSLEVLPILEEIDSNPDSWGQFRERAEYEGSAHSSTDCIVLRGNKSRELSRFQEEIDSDWWRLSDSFPNTVAIVNEVCKQLGAIEIGKVMITSLFPESSIQEHVDEGGYADHYLRVHIPIMTNSEVVFRCGDEEINMEQGSVFAFDHKKPHSVENRSSFDRIHLIIDIRR